ncbi:tetraacyldisaccharide 4'-kinase [candidate division KSB1 bacterium]|nr:tetraacyldisaccharide 4'-kinase [candidate division KSB1 bacterium]
MTLFENKWPAILLWPFSIIYGAITVIRNLLFDTGILPTVKIDCPVISVGNITVGGTGKTPTVITIAEWLLEKGFKVSIISRGYARESKDCVIVSDGKGRISPVKEGGDEPVLLAKKLPGVAVLVDRNRVRAAQLALRKFSPDVIILDDGFQHRRIYRDLDIVTINKEKLFGNNFLLPAGPLREFRFNLQRTNIVWMNGNTGIETIPRLPKQIKSKPFIYAKYTPVKLTDVNGNKSKPELQSVPVVAFSGLGNPDSFKQTLHDLGARIKAFIKFKDHHFYTEKDILGIEETFKNSSAKYILTTEKDWVKLPLNFSISAQWKYLSIKIEPLNRNDLQKILIFKQIRNRINIKKNNKTLNE